MLTVVVLLRIMSLADSKPIAVRVSQQNFSCPGLFNNFRAKLSRELGNIVHIKVEKRVWPGITFVLGKVNSLTPPVKEQVQRQAWGKPVFALDLETKPCIPLGGLMPSLHMQDRNQLLRQSSPRYSTSRYIPCIPSARKPAREHGRLCNSRCLFGLQALHKLPVPLLAVS